MGPYGTGRGLGKAVLVPWYGSVALTAQKQFVIQNCSCW